MKSYCGRNWRRHFKSIMGCHAGMKMDRSAYPLDTALKSIPAHELTAAVPGVSVIPQKQRRYLAGETSSRMLKWIRRKLQWIDCRATRILDRA